MQRPRLGDAIHHIQAVSRQRKLDRMLSLLQPRAGSTFLEVGIGNSEPLPVTNFVVRNYPWPRQITALGLGDLSGFMALHPEVRTVSFEGGRFPFRDREFDLAHSNAVIEHVGSTAAQEEFLAEMVRVAPAGMLTTPDKYFPIETHSLLPFLHWLGKERFDAAVQRMGPDRIDRVFRRLGREFPAYELADLRLLSAGDLRRMARRAGLRHFTVHRNRMAGLSMTLSLVWTSAF